MDMFRFIKTFFLHNIPIHYCNFEFVGYCSHFNQVSEIDKSISNPHWHHYPSTSTKKQWLKEGFVYAQVYQSHWNCSCGKKLTYFFLANPEIEFGKPIQTISTLDCELMKHFNPLKLGSSRGHSMAEVTDELIEKFC